MVLDMVLDMDNEIPWVKCLRKIFFFMLIDAE